MSQSGTAIPFDALPARFRWMHDYLARVAPPGRLPGRPEGNGGYVPVPGARPPRAVMTMEHV